jgi:hypothetical protein
MLVHLFDKDGFETTVGVENVDGAIGLAEPDGVVSLPGALEWVVTESWNGASSFEAVNANEVGPEGELSNDLRGSLGQLLAGGLGKLNLH